MRTKHLRRVFILMTTVMVIFVGCDKNEIVEPEINEPVATDQITTQSSCMFFIDDEIATEQEYNNFTEKSDDLLIIQTALDSKTALYAYTTEEAYIAYGERKGINLKGELEFSKHMKEYAEKSGAIAEYEKTGKIPNRYNEYEKKYYEKVFGLAKNEKGLGKLCDYHNAGGDYIPFVNGATTPALPKNWRNRISSVFNAVGVAVYTVPLYDKTWYRQKLTTVVVSPLPGDRIHNLIGYRDNAAESFIVF